MEIGNKAIDFKLKDCEENEVSLSQYFGQWIKILSKQFVN